MWGAALFGGQTVYFIYLLHLLMYTDRGRSWALWPANNIWKFVFTFHMGCRIFIKTIREDVWLMKHEALHQIRREWVLGLCEEICFVLWVSPWHDLMFHKTKLWNNNELWNLVYSQIWNLTWVVFLEFDTLYIYKHKYFIFVCHCLKIKAKQNKCLQHAFLSNAQLRHLL